jgi:tRNA A-37 threonylcarbamoyl transferase component Bud32
MTFLLGGALLGVSAAIGLLLLARRSLELKSALRSQLTGALRERSPEVFALYLEYLAGGGDGGFLSADEVFTLVSLSPLTGVLLARLPEAHLLEAARRYSDERKTDRALTLLDDRVLSHAARKEADCDKAAGILIRSLKAGEFVKTTCSGKPPEFLRAYAKAFLRQGLPDKTLELLGMKAPGPRDLALRVRALSAAGRNAEALQELDKKQRPDWSAEECAAAFRLFLAEGLWDRLKEAYPVFRGQCPVKVHPDLYYEYAARCEEAGDLRVAAEVYGRFWNEGFVYKDAMERYESAKAALDEEPSLPVQPKAVEKLRPKEEAPASGVVAVPTSLIGGKYELRMPIGEGGMGVVYEAFDRNLGRKVAVKRMHEDIRSDARERARFLREARIAARVTHAYIVGVLDVVEEGGEIYLVLEYVDGKPLSEVLEERGRLSVEECQSVFSYISQAVDCAHRGEVLHRDLKPSNVMLCREGYAKVMDFGLAHAAGEPGRAASARESCGTLAYMAPEQHRGEARRESDIFSMGATLYESLTGERPFKGPDFLAQKERRSYPSLRKLVPGLPADADALIAAALEPDPEKRISTALEFLEGLKRL